MHKRPADAGKTMSLKYTGAVINDIERQRREAFRRQESSIAKRGYYDIFLPSMDPSLTDKVIAHYERRFNIRYHSDRNGEYIRFHVASP